MTAMDDTFKLPRDLMPVWQRLSNIKHELMALRPLVANRPDDPHRYLCLLLQGLCVRTTELLENVEMIMYPLDAVVTMHCGGDPVAAIADPAERYHARHYDTAYPPEVLKQLG